MTEKGHKYGTLPSELSVKEIMDTWTLQAGFPVITITKNGNNLVLTQQRYMLPKSNSTDKSKWFIPITYAREDYDTPSEIPSHWMTDMEETITIPNVVEHRKWLYVNVNRSG